MMTMHDYTWIGPLTAPIAIAVGILACFWGYRIVKLLLGIIGFVLGAAGGWELASSLVPGHELVALVCAGIGGIVGAVLCIWLFLLGIFLLGASAGTVVASAVFAGTGHQAQPLLFLAFAVVFGLLALLLQKFMIAVSTAFSGSYLVTAGILRLIAGQHTGPLWFDPSHTGAPDVLGYVVLAFWFVLGLVGVSFQFRGSRRREEITRHEAQPATS
jgi:hypothetical protein